MNKRPDQAEIHRKRPMTNAATSVVRAIEDLALADHTYELQPARGILREIERQLIADELGGKVVEHAGGYRVDAETAEVIALDVFGDPIA